MLAAVPVILQRGRSSQSVKKMPRVREVPSSNAEGNNEQGEAARTAAVSNSSSSESDNEQVDDDLDSQTVQKRHSPLMFKFDEETIMK
ncbi:hypothetical protein O9992_27775 [Vibrio lentus]|nr:hypothetical protein [Vibrio lentus]